MVVQVVFAEDWDVVVWMVFTEDWAMVVHLAFGKSVVNLIVIVQVAFPGYVWKDFVNARAAELVYHNARFRVSSV